MEQLEELIGALTEIIGEIELTFDNFKRIVEIQKEPMIAAKLGFLFGCLGTARAGVETSKEGLDEILKFYREREGIDDDD